MDNDKSLTKEREFSPKQQAVERLKEATNVLVTVKSNPNIDELASTIGLTLLLNKLEKHSTAVFSGEVPSTLEFLKPEETIETNTDSLRDFIVSLDKSKADKLRYKVEENVVKIFITPYRTSISEADLEFTQGDFNVDVVVALGVTKREELDQAIMMHGRILHDATFITITAGADFSDLGQINWQDQGASSLSEMLVSISESFESGIIDTQIATAFLTGIVSETQRFSNPKTTPKVMTMAAQLMSAGANQQLIANELEKASEVNIDHSMNAEVESVTAVKDVGATESSDGTLNISHENDESKSSVNSMAGEPSAMQKVADEAGAVTDSLADGGAADLSLDNQPESKVGSPHSQLLTDGIQPKDESSRLYTDVANSDSDKTSATVAGVDLPALQADSSTAAADNSVAAGGILPPLNDTPAPVPVPAAGRVDVDEHNASILIDTEGNLTRKTAAQPKHKVVQPIANEPVIGLPHPGEDLINDASLADIEESLGIGPRPDALAAPEAAVGSLDTSMPAASMTGVAIEDNTTLEDIEKAVDSPHLKQSLANQQGDAGVSDARSAVTSALGEMESSPGPRPLSTPPDPVPYDSFRLPVNDSFAPEINDVSGNLSELSNSTSTEFIAEGAMAPPPVPPPMIPPGQQAL